MPPTLAVRNANPGNIKDPGTGSFRQFSNPGEGGAALLNDLRAKQTGTTTTGLGPSSTLVDFSEKWAPSSDNNNPGQYAANLANYMGVSPATQLKDLDLGKWAEAISLAEDRDSATAMGIGSSGSGGSYAPPPQVKEDAVASVEQPAGEDKNILQKGLEFFFPILEKKERTPLETLGDVGLSALTLVPGLGAAGLAAKGAKLAATGAKVASKASSIPGLVAKGAGVGYGADVAGNLSEGKTDAGEILTPGLGTAIGGIGGGVVGGASKLAPSVLSKTSGVPRAAMDIATEQPGKVSGLIKGGVTPESTRKVAVGAVKDLRKKMSSEWESGVQSIVDKYEGVRVGLPETVGNELKDIASRYNTATKQRIGIPQNPLSMSAKELTGLIKDINGIKYNPLQPDRALSDMKKYLKDLGKKSFNEGGEFTSLYANYATKSDILESADDIVRAFKAKKPTQITTAINRLQKVFDEDKEEYLKAIQALERETGIDILSGVAAGKVKPIMPDFGRGFDLGDILKLAGFMVTSPRGAYEINKLLQGASGPIGKTIRGATGLLPVLPGLSGTQ